LGPQIGTIHSHYSIFLSVISKFDEAIAQGKLALQLDPLSIRLHRNQAMRYYFARHHDEAVRQYSEALELDPNDALLHEELGDVYEQMGRHQESIAEWQKALSLAGDAGLAALVAQLYAEVGFAAALQALAQRRLELLNERVSKGEYVPAAHFARAYLRLGETEQAFHWLERARDERNALALLMKSDPFYDSLRSHPRFAAILKSMNLE
jgi:tetratricopeptide (TPR) repeat protein